MFDQSLFVKQAISTVLREGGIGLFLTAVMILIFLGSLRATAAVFLSIPLSVMATFFFLHTGNQTINSMVLSGLALAFSRLIDNSVIVLENIFRHVELGEKPAVAAEKGAKEVGLAVLAITIVTVVVFFPVTLLFGVSKFLFTALALSVVLSLSASYFVAISVVPLYCAKLLRGIVHHEDETVEPGQPQIPPIVGNSVSCGFQCSVREDAGSLRPMGAESRSTGREKSCADSSRSSC